MAQYTDKDKKEAIYSFYRGKKISTICEEKGMQPSTLSAWVVYDLNQRLIEGDIHVKEVFAILRKISNDPNHDFAEIHTDSSEAPIKILSCIRIQIDFL